jgi:hypothetical protein
LIESLGNLPAMRLPLLLRATAILLGTTFADPCLHSQSEYSPDQLASKKRFTDREFAALDEPYLGVRASTGIEADLYSIQPTAVSTQPLMAAAHTFLASLSPTQILRTHFAVDDTEWRRWFNVDNGIYVRQGTSLLEMDAAQKTAARNLMAATLSARGLALTDAIRHTDQTLHELNHNAFYLDEELYYFTVMGVPSSTEPWGWQIDGHHLVINAFVLGDQIVMTPTFLGAEPAVALTGKYAGNAVLQEEQNDGLAFMRSLSPSQQKTATLSTDKRRNDIQAEALKDNAVVDYAGINAVTFSPVQRQAFLDLIHHYIGNLRDGHAEKWMDAITAQLDQTFFAWVGTTEADAVFYYRIHSPVILIEFDHQNPVGTRILHPGRQPTRDHIHTIIRTPNGNDYGKDLLRLHLQSHPH